MRTIQGLKQWQTARVVTAEDTLLTDYKPTDLTATVIAKMISVHPATSIALRAWGKGSSNDVTDLIISGWMDPNSEKGPGPGHRLWRGKLQLGSKTFTDVPLDDGKWGASAAWRESDQFDFVFAGKYDMVGATVLDSTHAPDVVANQETILLLPVLGYSHLLLEIRNLDSANEMTEVGILWRQVDFQGLNLNPYPNRIVRTNEEP